MAVGISTHFRVIACDSGSDKSFDFLGVATVIECVKELILSLWNRVIYFSEYRMSERIKLVAEALPVIEKSQIFNNRTRSDLSRVNCSGRT